MQLESLYQEIILDHYRHPHHKGLREPYDAEVRHVNPTCGDEVTLRVALKDAGAEPVVADISWDALGCSISQASVSVMSDLIIGKPVSEALATCGQFVTLMQSRGEASPTRTCSGTRSRSRACRSTRPGSSAPCSAGWPGRTRPRRR